MGDAEDEVKQLGQRFGKLQTWPATRLASLKGRMAETPHVLQERNGEGMEENSRR
jgi:hypothetical protein